MTKEYYARHIDTFEGLTASCMNTGSKERRENYYFNSVGFRRNWRGITIFVDRYINKKMISTYGGAVNVAFISEPECIVNDTNKRVIENIDNIDLILTNKDYLLEHYPKKTVWIPTAVPTIAERYCGVGAKTKICSHIISKKQDAPGHKLRHKIAKEIIMQGDKNITLHGDGIRNGWRDEKGEFLQKYCFSLAIENDKQKNYYTEKILDCFATGTVPIYWGGEITKKDFNEKGIIYFNSNEEFESIKEKIYEDPIGEYTRRLEYICENKRLVESYKRLDDIILLETIEFISRQKESKYRTCKIKLDSFYG